MNLAAITRKTWLTPTLIFDTSLSIIQMAATKREQPFLVPHEPHTHRHVHPFSSVSSSSSTSLVISPSSDEENVPRQLPPPSIIGRQQPRLEYHEKRSSDHFVMKPVQQHTNQTVDRPEQGDARKATRTQHASQLSFTEAVRRTPSRFAGWRNWSELSIKLRNTSPNLTLHAVHSGFQKQGSVEYIELFDGKAGPFGCDGRVRFRPPPTSPFWEQAFYIPAVDGKGQVAVQCELERPRDQPRYPSPVVKGRFYDERMSLKAANLDFGIMLEPTKFMVKKSVNATDLDPISLGLNMRFQELIIDFYFMVSAPQAHFPRNEKPPSRREHFRFAVPFNQMHNVNILQAPPKVLKLLIPLRIPPKFFRKVTGAISRVGSERQWSDSDSWFRQTDIVWDHTRLRNVPLTSKPDKIDRDLDIGRWTTYCLTLNMSAADDDLFEQMQLALQDYNVDLVGLQELTVLPPQESIFWNVIDPPEQPSAHKDLLELTEHSGRSLDFDVQYQLEVCISRGILNEHNLTAEFAKKLINMDRTAAKEVLEHVANQTERIFDPMSIFSHNVVLPTTPTNVPHYCTSVQSVIITPTTVKFNTPTVDTSNRILRQFSNHSDRFIRVRFTDEAPGAKIYGTDKHTQDELFTRIKRTFASGIMVGDRRFEFLAFGNSQFREHGAYFYAPLPGLTKGEIRAWMGSFTHIEYVALFASRLGQCFSTTRAITTQFELREIEDIRRNGYYFTDGVGKISPTLALVIADDLKISQKNQEPSSVYQFRLGGCKGVLAVWPDVKDREIHIRESQYKFPSAYEGLEVIRFSQYASANLNRQLILVLSTLGVPDNVFQTKLNAQLSDIDEAMSRPDKALAILQRDIDHNQMTLKLAGMVLDGFQERNEPFIRSLLRLWRAWSIKYLKERARIVIDEGALVLGVVDETGILRGHKEIAPRLPPHAPISQRADSLPQIFVQLSKGVQGKAKVITGPMLVARNPSLHPGDIRVVCGVDVPELHHLKDCVVMPQTGDRDIASMCSGGDLDGDDFVIIWDQDLLPAEWNHRPMAYTAPEKKKHTGPVTDLDLANFFINYIKMDTLPTIAHAHVAFADASECGVKDPKCK